MPDAGCWTLFSPSGNGFVSVGFVISVIFDPFSPDLFLDNPRKLFAVRSRLGDRILFSG